MPSPAPAETPNERLSSVKAVVILNASAGPKKPEEKAALRDRIRELFVEAGCEADVRLVDGKAIKKAVAQAISSGVDAVVAAGGDGTISTVAGALAGGPVPLGVLPLGTRNHFARDAGIPLDLEEAVRVVATGTVKPVDVGEVNGRAFVNNSSVGVYPVVVKGREAVREITGRGKWSAMLMVSLRMLRRFPMLHVLLRVDGKPIRRRTPFVFVGNNEYDLELFKRGMRDALDRGVLSVYTANCGNAWCIARLVMHLLMGRLKHARDFEAMTVTEVWIVHRRRSLYVSLDGEVARLQPPLRYRIRPRALKVIVP